MPLHELPCAFAPLHFRCALILALPTHPSKSCRWGILSRTPDHCAVSTLKATMKVLGLFTELGCQKVSASSLSCCCMHAESNIWLHQSVGLLNTAARPSARSYILCSAVLYSMIHTAPLACAHMMHTYLVCNKSASVLEHPAAVLKCCHQ